MPLVEYSSSESSDSSGAEETGIQSNSHQRPKRKRDTSPESHLPPLPETFHDLYASTARVSQQDDPSLHGGRQRVTPHVEGNWPTHIYIECKFVTSLNHKIFFRYLSIPAYGNEGIHQQNTPASSMIFSQTYTMLPLRKKLKCKVF